MNNPKLEDVLLSIKLNDGKLASTAMPTSKRIVSKTLARTLGNSSGQILLAYETMFDDLNQGKSLESVKESAKDYIAAKSRVEIKIPLLKKPKKGRNCGLVTLNHVGFFDAEAELYGALISDIQSKEYSGTNDLLSKIREVAQSNPEKYSKLLEQKQNRIYDFGVLMGINSDSEHFKDLTQDMHRGHQKYFKFVSNAHKGGILRPSWPFSFSKFANPIQQGMYLDTISYEIQEAVGKDFGFTNPNTEYRHNMFAETTGKIKALAKKYSSDNRTISLKLKLATLANLPVSAMYLYGYQAQTAAKTGADKLTAEHPGLAATLSALGCMVLCGDGLTDRDGDARLGAFSENWTTTYTTFTS